jgi:nucleotide-binding universal stress UspA family protein
MAGFDTVLVPIDFSEESHAALRLGTAIARASERGKLHLVHAFELRLPVDPPYDTVLPDAYVATLRADVDRRVDAAALALRTAEVDFERHVVDGPAAEVICECATRFAADVVVMGTRGLSGLEHVLLGSVAERTVRRAPCPVITVRESAAHAESRPFRRLLVALDFSAASEAALALALDVAPADAEIHLVHVFSPPLEIATAYGVELPTATWSDVRNAADAQLDRARTEVERRGRTVAAYLALGRPAHEIVEIARKVSADLIVMGTRGRSGLGRWLLGSVAERVLQTASCPVLTVRGQHD